MWLFVFYAFHLIFGKWRVCHQCWVKAVASTEGSFSVCLCHSPLLFRQVQSVLVALLWQVVQQQLDELGYLSIPLASLCLMPLLCC